MTDLEAVAPFDVRFIDLEITVYAWVEEALELRHGTAGDPDGPLSNLDLRTTDYPALVAALERVRKRSDRVDELLSKVTQAKGRAKRAEAQAAFAAQNAKDSAARVNSTRRAEFSARFEREADANLDSLEERRIAHHAERIVAVTAEAFEIVNQVHWQLDSLRKDIREMMRVLQFESSLDR